MRVLPKRDRRPEVLRATTVRQTTHEIAVYWWIYRYAFLEAKQAALRERIHVDPTTIGAMQQRESETLLHQIPPADRVTFEAHWDEALRAAAASAGPAADPDTVEGAAITNLIDEAEGRASPEGWGRVPEVGDTWYDVQPIPTRDPRVATASSTARAWPAPRRVLLGGLIVIGGLVATWWSLPTRSVARAGGEPMETTTATAQAATTGQATPTPLGDVAGDAPNDPEAALRPTSLELVRGRRYVLPVDPSPGVLGAAWTPDLQTGRAAWLHGTTVNLVLCLAPADAALVERAEADETWTLRIASGETRHYRAQEPRTVGRQEREVMDQRHAGLTLIACGASGNDRTIVEAALQPAALTTDD